MAECIAHSLLQGRWQYELYDCLLIILSRLGKGHVASSLAVEMGTPTEKFIFPVFRCLP